MASSPATNQDTLVNLKVNLEGTNRRFKLPLKDLVPSTLPDKLRTLLSIPPTSEVIFERYSDSAADFVTLDPNNASVYKQLYRAAKAKLKLRLKVTVINQEDKEPIRPKPASVEDEAQNSQEVQRTDYWARPSCIPVAEAQAKEGVARLPILESPNGLTFNFKQASDVSASHPTPVGPTNVQVSAVPSPACSAIPVTRGPAARDKWYAELAALAEERRAALSLSRSESAVAHPRQMSHFSVYCNSCQHPIPDEHYHCSTCDDGDFDLCQDCISNGLTCGGEGHWMIKRSVKNGKVIASVTETLPPRAVPASASKATLVQTDEPLTNPEREHKDVALYSRTCNSCIQGFPEEDFVTCVDCEDFDLCVRCHKKVSHGHNPKHAFEPAVQDTLLEPLARALLRPGRNVAHQAICDGCDKYIYGVRHKCLDCPDWDYCQTCIPNAKFIHPRHRFVPIYEPLQDIAWPQAYGVVHAGVYCDGPLCKNKSSNIRGDRYKCAVCHDTDFCAGCEASPSNLHNKTHPLIKFKTPIRNVSVTTMGDRENGRAMPIMGDRIIHTTPRKPTGNTSTVSGNSATTVQTVADLKPSETVDPPAETETDVEAKPKVEEAKELECETQTTLPNRDLIAHFVRDAVPDGTILAPGVVFEQTWTLRNGGGAAWPAGCSVKFVGGDNMCAVDPAHPASVHELVSAAESTTCNTDIAPGQEHNFTVLMRTPQKPGKAISYWRLTGPDGYKFGHRLWCDVKIEGLDASVKEEVVEKDAGANVKEEASESQLIFPELAKESPVSSMHEDHATVQDTPENEQETVEVTEDDFVDFTSETHVDDETEDGFLTDEEYDILDASDGEYPAQQTKLSK